MDSARGILVMLAARKSPSPEVDACKACPVCALIVAHQIGRRRVPRERPYGPRLEQIDYKRRKQVDNRKHRIG